MVRLKGSFSLSNILGCLSFQFQYGTIKSQGASLQEELNYHFNSSMVRLKATGKVQ